MAPENKTAIKPRPAHPLQSFGLANFKAFGPSLQMFPLRPITLVFGANGSGKSSFIHSLLWLKDTWETGNPDVHQPRSAGTSVDLGGFRQFRFKGEPGSDITASIMLDSANLGFQAGSLVTLTMTYSTKSVPTDLRRRVLALVPNKIAKLRASHPEWSEEELTAHLIAYFHPLDILDELGEWSLPWREASTKKSRYYHKLISRACPTIVKVWKRHHHLIFSAEWFNPPADRKERSKVFPEAESFINENRKKAELEFLPTIKEWKISLTSIEEEMTSYYCDLENLTIVEETETDVSPRVTNTGIELDGIPLLRFELRDDQKYWVTKLEGALLLKLAGSDSFETEAAGLPNLDDASREQFFVESLQQETPQVHFDALNYARTLRFFSSVKSVLTESEIKAVTKLLTHVLVKVHELRGCSFSHLNYLGPLRVYPDRDFSQSVEAQSKDGSGGISAWRSLADDPKLRFNVNSWLANKLNTGYELRTDHVVSLQKLEQVLQIAYEKEMTRIQELFGFDLWEVITERSFDALGNMTVTDIKSLHGAGGGRFKYDSDLLTQLDKDGFWQRMITAAKAGVVSPGRTILRIHDLRTGADVSHRDIGMGISQVLPVLVQAMGAKDEWIAIEQPEIHLHPALQAELGDVFIESAITRGNCFVLETHSEHLILRLLRRIRETTAGELDGRPPLRPEDICVLYVEPGEGGAKVTEIPVGTDGDFDRPWPHGFFGERSKELF